MTSYSQAIPSIIWKVFKALLHIFIAPFICLPIMLMEVVAPKGASASSVAVNLMRLAIIVSTVCGAVMLLDTGKVRGFGPIIVVFIVVNIIRATFPR